MRTVNGVLRVLEVVVEPPALPVKVGQRASLGDRLLYVNHKLTLSQAKIFTTLRNLIEMRACWTRDGRPW